MTEIIWVVTWESHGPIAAYEGRREGQALFTTREAAERFALELLRRGKVTVDIDGRPLNK